MSFNFKADKNKLLLVALTIVILSIYLLVFWSYFSYKSNLKELKAEVSELESRVRKNFKILKENEKLKKRLKKISQNIPSFESEALAFAKIQGVINDLSSNYEISLERVRIVKTRKVNDTDFQETKVFVKCKGNPVEVLKFLNAIEKKLYRQGIAIKKINLYSTQHYSRKERKKMLDLTLYIALIWKREKK